MGPRTTTSQRRIHRQFVLWMVPLRVQWACFGPPLALLWSFCFCCACGCWPCVCCWAGGAVCAEACGAISAVMASATASDTTFAKCFIRPPFQSSFALQSAQCIPARSQLSRCFLWPSVRIVAEAPRDLVYVCFVTSGIRPRQRLIQPPVSALDDAVAGSMDSQVSEATSVPRVRNSQQGRSLHCEHARCFRHPHQRR